MSVAMHLRDVKNKASRKARADRLWRKELAYTQALARAGQIAAQDRLYEHFWWGRP